MKQTNYIQFKPWRSYIIMSASITTLGTNLSGGFWLSVWTLWFRWRSFIFLLFFLKHLNSPCVSGNGYKLYGADFCCNTVPWIKPMSKWNKEEIECCSTQRIFDFLLPQWQLLYVPQWNTLGYILIIPTIPKNISRESYSSWFHFHVF